jgi:hypothetical protein
MKDMDLSLAVEEELIRLKSIQSTLDILHLSAKKQLSEYISSSKKKSKGESEEERK